MPDTLPPGKGPGAMLAVPSMSAYGYISYGGPETETWFDRPEPVPGPSELVIKLKAVGVNPVDNKIRSSAMANPQATPDFPLVLLAKATTHKPLQVSFVQAAALPVAGGTAWDVLGGWCFSWNLTQSDHRAVR